MTRGRGRVALPGGRLLPSLCSNSSASPHPTLSCGCPQDARPATLSVPRDPAPPGEENDLWEGTNGVALSTMCQSTSAKPGSRMLA